MQKHIVNSKSSISSKMIPVVTYYYTLHTEKYKIQTDHSLFESGPQMIAHPFLIQILIM